MLRLTWPPRARERPGWHLAFAVLVLLTGFLAARESDLDASRRAGALILLVLLGVWYLAVGAQAVAHSDHRRGSVYLAGAVPLTLALFVATPAGGLLLFALYPHIWTLLAPRAATAVTVLTVACVSAGMLARAGLDRESLLFALVQAGGALFVALVLGLSITSVVQQSRRRATLLAELEATRAELARVSHEAGAMAERERLSGEIHDTLAQGFASILLLLQAAEAEILVDPAGAANHVRQAQRTAKDNLAEARSLVAELAPPDLQYASLPDALRRLVQRVDGALTADFAVEGTPVGLPPNTQVVLLRAAQEALTNVRRHAAATTVQVRLTYSDSWVAICVRDDGRGFDPAAITLGFGLDGLRRRSGQVGAALHLDTATGAGATLTVRVPLDTVSRP